MNHSSILSSQSQSSYLDESLLNPNSEVKANRNQVDIGKNQDIILKKDLLERYPLLFAETMKILGQRSSNEDLKNLASEYQQIYGKFINEGKLSKLQEMEPKQQGAKFKQIEIIKNHKKITDQIDSIDHQRDQILSQIQEMDSQKISKRLKLKLLTKIIKQAIMSEDNSPYQFIDQEYNLLVVRILNQYDKELENSRLGIVSQDPSQEFYPSEQKQKARRNRIKQQIDKLQWQRQSLKKMTKKQQFLIKSLKQQIKKSQNSQSQIYQKLQIKGDVDIRRNIIGDLVEKFITKKMKQKDFDYGLEKSVNQYVQNIEQLKNQTFVLKKQLQQQLLINVEKNNQCLLLEKKLTELKKGKKHENNILNKESQSQDQINTKSMNNEQMIIKAYHFEGNKIQSELSQIQEKHKKQQVSMFLEQQTKNYLQSNQKVSVKNNQSQGWMQKLFGIKTSKQKLNIALIIWLIVLVFLFSRAFLIRYEYLPKSQPVRPPRTVIHRYQGKNRIVDGQIVNISHFDQTLIDKSNQKENIENYRPQEQVIVIEPVPQHPKKSWVDMLKMQYK